LIRRFYSRQEALGQLAAAFWDKFKQGLFTQSLLSGRRSSHHLFSFSFQRIKGVPA
jgi:hypothetical protein